VTQQTVSTQSARPEQGLTPRESKVEEREKKKRRKERKKKILTFQAWKHLAGEKEAVKP